MLKKMPVVFLFFALALAPLSQAHAISNDDRATIAMTGTGTVTAPADIVHITTGVVSEAKTARSALDENTAAMARIVTGLKAQGLVPKDIQTTDFSIRPRYGAHKDGAPPRVIAYQVTNSVRITVRDIKQLGAILDQVVSLGSNQIGGISFAIDDPKELQNEARRRATKDATAKAELYAKAAGVDLGDIVAITENAAGGQPRPMMARMAMEAGPADVPIEPGEQTIEMRVNITWEIK